MKGKPENGTSLKPTLLWESHESSGGEGLLTGSIPISPRGVLSGIVLRGGESPLHGEGPDGSTQPSKETYAGRVGPGKHKPTSLERIAKRARSCKVFASMISIAAKASTTEKPDAGKLHVRVWVGGAW
jgi:hypothetical protein